MSPVEPWWVRSKIPPYRVMEILKARADGFSQDKERLFNPIRFNDVLTRALEKFKPADTLVQCPKCGRFLDIFRITSGKLYAKREPDETSAAARIRVLTIVTGFRCKICGETFFIDNFTEEMKKHIYNLGTNSTNEDLNISLEGGEETVPTGLDGFMSREPSLQFEDEHDTKEDDGDPNNNDESIPE